MARRATIALASLGLASIGLYAARRTLIGRALGLRPASHAVALQADLAVPMADGVELIADRFHPVGAGPFPTIVIRTPYGRASDLGAFGALYTIGAQLFAERGYNVLVQSVRGRFRSGGSFDPFVHEAADGLDTLAWVAAQPWFDGSLGMWGPSYLGYCQWAVAAAAPPYLKAIVPMVTSARFSRLFFPEGALAFESVLRWTHLIQATSSSRLDLPALWRLSPMRSGPQIAAAFAHLPVAEADAVAVGAPVSYFRRWMQEADLDGAYWRRVDLHRSLAKVDVPAHLVAGWHDIFLNGQLADYLALLAAGKRPYLTVLPRHHLDTMLIWEGLREGLDWFDVHLRGDEGRLRRRPVRLALMGSDEHHEMDYWPPPARLTRYYLADGGALKAEAPAAVQTPHWGVSAPAEAPAAAAAAVQTPHWGSSSYTYDPADPTPGVGGPVLSAGAGPRAQGRVEARADVLIFTTSPLPADVDVVGPVRAELYVRSSLAHTDVVARLCRVDRAGRSSNVCDGLFRLEPGKGAPQADGSLRIEVDMWATGQRFRAGERIRLQVASAAHPRWSRHLGHGPAHEHAAAGPVAEQTIYHDAEHPSALVLPVMTYEF